MSAADDTCMVCVETYNKSTRKPIECPLCHERSCRTCTQTYILETPQDAQCMHCKKQWDYNVLCELMTKVFVAGPYRDHRQKVLMDRERSLLPATQPLVEREFAARKMSERLNVYHKKVVELTKLLNAAEYERQLWSNRMYAVRNMEPARVTLVTDWDPIIRGEQGIPRLANAGAGAAAEPAPQRAVFTQACPADGCRGFLSTQWKCGLCDVWCCPDCHEIKGMARDVPHECDPAILANARAVAAETRNCPNCACAIYRISGCDLMWCVQCHTSFSWRTGQKVTGGVNHNPHFYEWQRRNGGGTAPRAAGDVICGGPVDVYEYARKLDRCGIRRTDPEFNILYMGHRMMTHVLHVEIPRLPVADDPRGTDNEDLRIQWMLKEITTEHWKASLLTREKARNKKAQLRMVWDMFAQTMQDLTRRVMQQTDRAGMVAMAKEMDEFRKYTNECFLNLSKKLSCSAPQILDDWDLSSTGRRVKSDADSVSTKE